MEQTLINPGYFGPIDQFYAFVNSENVVWEAQDNYQKQTYRNRQYIYGANGRLSLTIPIRHTHKNQGRQKYKEVKVENQFDWQRTHWKSLKSAYQSSPFFEFYEDDLRPLYDKKFNFLRDFNQHCWEAVLAILQLPFPSQTTSDYLKDYDPGKITDLRPLTAAKRQTTMEFPPYSQVFQEKHGFIPNLSILDLLFNKGPETLSYLNRPTESPD